MISFEAVGNGGKEQLREAIEACEKNGATVVEQESIPQRGIFKLKVTCSDNIEAQAAVQAARFSLVYFN